ncbi:MAG: hypothetical protein BA862_06670 [Desulfobulbaceae bacterium S3730MH12]|nr:MAG: hypothetical protein BA866_02875 [Desulfobulbaceae bacterium S5133MH15]OEU55499.1 MAG: hypothetical protein BA862_06670 [Desulfobulbaceae bacterium S3730MH12]
MTNGQSIKQIKQYLFEQFSLTEEQIETMLPGFISTLVSHMQNLENALVENNPTTMGRAAHTIKGAFLNLGLEECAQTASLIEEKGKAGDMTTDFQKLINDLRCCLDPVISPLQPE